MSGKHLLTENAVYVIIYIYEIHPRVHTTSEMKPLLIILKMYSMHTIREYTLQRKALSTWEQVPTALQANKGIKKEEDISREHTSMALTKGPQQSCEITPPQVQPNCLQIQPATRTEEGKADRRQIEARVPPGSFHRCWKPVPTCHFFREMPPYPNSLFPIPKLPLADKPAFLAT